MGRQAKVRLLLCVTLTASVLSCACPPKPSPADSITNNTDPRWVFKQHDPHADVALVFIHGIFGDTLGTWSNSNGTTFFDLLKNDPAIGPKVDMFAFGYPSKMVRAGSFDIQEAMKRLHEHLEVNKVLDYPAIVFVAHSMGGLVVLRELLSHRELLERVRVVVFYSTPQEGSQITNIATHIANNPALAQMLPANGNAFLQQLNDDWKQLQPRPEVKCAYEKNPTHGILIVDWASATRFCDGSPIAVDADHISIVKPDRVGHDSYVLLSNALNKFVLGESLKAKLETPDFHVENNEATLLMSDPFGRRDARLVNAGGTKLSFTLNEFPDSGLFVVPGPGPAEIRPNSTQVLQFVLGLGATASEYRFVLHSDVASDLPVTLKVPDLPAILARRAQTADKVLQDLQATLSDPAQVQKLKDPPTGGPDAGEQLVGVVRDAIAKQDPKLSEGAQWVQAAELLNEVNWPDLAAHAVKNAVRVQPELERVGSIRRLAARTGGLSGDDHVLASVPAELPEWNSLSFSSTPFTTATTIQRAAVVARGMRAVPSLAGHASILQGDVESARGRPEAAVAAYSAAVGMRASPLRTKKLAHARDMLHAVPHM